MLGGLLARRAKAVAEVATVGARGLAQAAGKEMRLPPQHGVPGRYAAALYMAAVKSGNLDAVESELAQVSSLMTESKDFSGFVADPSITSLAKATGLNAVLGKMGASDVTKNFVALLSENNRLPELAKILSKFGELMAEQRGEVKAMVTTAEGLSREEISELQGGLTQMLQPGQTLVLEENIDPTIIGGLIIDVGDKHVDLSILSRVRKLQQLVRDAV